MFLEFEVTTRLKVDAPGPGVSAPAKHLETTFILSIDKRLRESGYFEDGVPNVAGTRIATQVLCSGLAANIHAAHQGGQWDSAAHLRYAIEEITRQFAMPANTDKTVWEDRKR